MEKRKGPRPFLRNPEPVGTLLNQEELERLDKTSTRLGVSRSSLIRKAINYFLDGLEKKSPSNDQEF